ncbi:MAG: DUF429 domain-containing protein [Candidatus Pacearchaeota archaeon]|nr:MAG: DUF429 domain-containing protein [Candidatus Pacearchaeota archaeon]
MIFVGLDLAWSSRNNSAIAILEGNKKEAKLISFKDKILTNEEIIDFITRETKNKNTIIAIDAPLLVPNENGRRIAEDYTGHLFREYHAGAHPANRKRLSWDGEVRGERIVKLLEKKGFEHNPFLKRFEKTNKIIEVYPHPSIVVLFNLKHILRYKARPKRNYEFRWKEFEKYKKYLKNLEKANPKLKLPKEIFKKKIKGLKGKALKEFEDLLDSIICAYISYYYWCYPEKCEVLGNMKKGYIMTPVFDFMKEKLKKFKSMKK